MPTVKITLTLEAARIALEAVEFKLRVLGEHTKQGRLCKDLVDRLERGVMALKEAQEPLVPEG